ncbi:prolipoprotein diacylglyceryl transferase [Sedimentisphaera salicampi]|uniref:Phosphatidylglycerol--prolipoprotein diacylglyceryl transferase n=1 Tax=Sedimentisphaera salicampi TaxID=1941349 RepID=A0A1W6LPM8_9BACT|nr:prolipoprotein diacylglyceryl transferase [Sedimentisphaera salicampi]ARN57755.1 Prolipoprotein diacylglyceryl transferase [Sedimentisphaera salicampi]
MFPELFRIPFTDLTVKSYGTMLVLGLFAGFWLIRKMCAKTGRGANAETLINAGMYSLIAGIIGARAMYVLHYRVYEEGFMEIFAVWNGGLELLGGVILAIAFILYYLWKKKCDMLTSLDILSVALLIGIAIGRIGCFLNGCCYGQVTELPVGVVFPYGSIVYNAQAHPDPLREREEPYIDLPANFYGLNTQKGWVPAGEENKEKYPLKPKDMLTEAERKLVSRGGPYQAKPVHPTQLYSSAANAVNCLLAFIFWRRYGSGRENNDKMRCKGCTFSLVFILYSISRFLVESLRDDNPYEVGMLTISQLISIGLFAAGVAGLIYYTKRNKANGLIR